MHPERHRFFHPQMDDRPEQEMEGPEVHHMGKVLRMKVGDEVILLDGRGRLSRAGILELRKETARLSILEDMTPWDTPSALHVAMSPPKNMDRLEWFLEKAVEMGIGTFSLINAERGERSKVRMDRLERIAVSAMKQSLRSHLPVLRPLQDFSEFIEQAKENERLIAHCYEGQKQADVPTIAPTLILIGPEGDFSPEEVREAMSHGFRALSLGAARLRTETAALKAVALFNRS